MKRERDIETLRQLEREAFLEGGTRIMGTRREGDRVEFTMEADVHEYGEGDWWKIHCCLMDDSVLQDLNEGREEDRLLTYENLEIQKGDFFVMREDGKEGLYPLTTDCCLFVVGTEGERDSIRIEYGDGRSTMEKARVLGVEVRVMNAEWFSSLVF